MSDQSGELTGPDLTQDGAPAGDVPDEGMLLGHADGEAVVLARQGSEVFAFGASCTHYGGPLADGLFDGTTVRCPWHHARFDVRSGTAVCAPAFDDIAVYDVESKDGRLFVGRARPEAAAERAEAASEAPTNVVVIGGGAAGYAAIDELRSRGYDGSLLLVSTDPALPYDRPNLSKDYLAGEAEEDWLPLRDEEFYRSRQIETRLGRRAERIDPEQRTITLDDGGVVSYDALILATGAEPVSLPVETAEDASVFYLRSIADSDRIISAAEQAQRAVVIGGSFIGTEVAAALRTRGVEVAIIDQAELPMQPILGDELAQIVKAIHEEHGVVFHTGRSVERIDAHEVALDDGSRVAADLVIVGIGVRPNTEIAETAGIQVDDGIVVDEYLQTSVPGIWAAGDIASWPDQRSGGRARVEHWVVAERQGQTAARNVLGLRETFDEVPFFWSAHYDLQINYVGHASDWDEARWSGDAAARDGLVSYVKDGRVLAVATLGRDQASLRAEVAMERGDESALESLSAE